MIRIPQYPFVDDIEDRLSRHKIRSECQMLEATKIYMSELSEEAMKNHPLRLHYLLQKAASEQYNAAVINRENEKRKKTPPPL